MAQKIQTGALYQPRGVGEGARWEGVSKGRGYMYTYGWFMLTFDRKQQNSVKQLSFNKKLIKKKPEGVRVKPISDSTQLLINPYLSHNFFPPNRLLKGWDPLLYLIVIRKRRKLRERVCVQFSSVQSLSHVRLFATPWIAARQASLFITIFRSSLRLTSIESVMPSTHLILSCLLLLLPPIPPSIRVFSNESTLRVRWPKYWSCSFSTISSKEHPGLISFRMDRLDLLAVQGTVKSLFQHHSSKISNGHLLALFCQY